MKNGSLRFAAALSLVLTFSSLSLPAFAADFSSWGHTMKITFSGYNRPETLTNFPAAVTFTNQSPFDYNHFLSPPNADLRFTDATLTNELSYEIEKWNTNGASFVWVRVPELAGTNTTIFALWGKSGQTAPAYTTNGLTWDAREIGVWHMAQTAAQDSTSNRFNGTAYGAISQVTGVVDGADDFHSSNDYVQVADNARFTLTNDYTVSAWIRPDPSNNYQAIIGTYNGTTAGFIFSLSSDADNRLIFWAGAGAWRTNSVGVPDGAWSHVVYSRSGTNSRFYVNGLCTTNIYNATSGGDGSHLQIGAGGLGWSPYRYDGRIDEVRLTGAERSSNWLWACYMNQGSNETFSTVLLGNPTIQSAAPSELTASSATLNGYLSSTGWAPSYVTAYWGTNDGGASAEGWAHTNAFADAQNVGPLSTNITGLESNRWYYYTFSASNAFDTRWSPASIPFKTYGLPSVDNAAGATGLGYTSATLWGTLLDGMSADALIYWGQDPGNLTNTLSAGTVQEGIFSAALTGLQNDATFYYRCFVSNLCGTALAATVANFTTPVMGITWSGAGANNLASNPTNWLGGVRPVSGDAVHLDATTNKAMTWDLSNITVRAWNQDAGYTGVVTFLTRYPGRGFFTNVTITGNCTLNGGTWTHPANTGGTSAYDRLSVTVGGNFTFGSGGRVDLTGRGYAASSGPGAGYPSQRASVVTKAASHGGEGARAANVTNTYCYGSIRAPETLGSGCLNYGGGAIRLFVDGLATLDGTMIANGIFAGTNPQMNGGNAGGSIYVKAGSVAGAGLLNASGSDGYWSGGGGRIALIATNAASLGNVVCRALAGVPNSLRGAAGSIYAETAANLPGHGRLIVDAQGAAPMDTVYTEFPPVLETYPVHPAISGEMENLVLQITNSGGRLMLTSSIRVGNIAWIASGSVLDLHGYTLFVKAPEPPLPFPQSYGNGTIVTNGGRIVWGDQSASVRVSITNGPHGAVSKSPYSPDDYYDFDSPVTLTATPDPGYDFLWWEGDVPAGSNRTSNPLVVAADHTLSFRALFATNDANARTWTGADTTTLASAPSNWWPVAAPAAGNHIIFDATSTRECSWNVDVPLGSWRQEAGYVDSYSGLEGYKGHVWILTKFPGQGSFTNLTITGDASLLDGAWAHVPNSGDTGAIDRLSVSVGGDFLLNTAAVINVTGRGFAAGRGPGAGNNILRNGSGIGLGASYGGRGANGAAITPSRCYGSATAPIDLGSGAYVAGGGSVRLSVGGHATLLSSILAVPTGAASSFPGATGGSIWLTAGSVSGQALLDASGLEGHEAGGGGRIAVILTNSTDFGSLILRAWGGPGQYTPFYVGAAGTIYKETPQTKTLLIDNNNAPVASSNWVTEIPAAGQPAPAELTQATLVLTNCAGVGITTNLTMGDLFIRTNSATLLYLKGNTLRLRAFYHPDWGAPARVVYDEGRIVWPAAGTIILIQ